MPIDTTGDGGDEKKWTPLHWAAQVNCVVETMNFALKMMGSLVKLMNESGDFCIKNDETGRRSGDIWSSLRSCCRSALIYPVNSSEESFICIQS